MEPIVEFIEEEIELDVLAKSPKKAKKAKKPKKKKKKKKKPVKSSRVKGSKNYKKGARKSKKAAAAGKKLAAKQKAAGKGLFKPVSLSPALAGIVGKKSASRPDVTKAVWKYIKSKKLNSGRTIKADAKLATVTKAGSFSMFKMAGMLNKHMK